MEVLGTILLVIAIIVIGLSCMGAMALVASDNTENISLPKKIYKWLFYGGLALIFVSYALSLFY